MDEEITVQMDFSDGFIEGYLAGVMMGSAGGCGREDCPRGE